MTEVGRKTHRPKGLDVTFGLGRCGESRNKPFCDNRHENSGLRDDGFLENNPYPGSSTSGGEPFCEGTHGGAHGGIRWQDD